MGVVRNLGLHTEKSPIWMVKELNNVTFAQMARVCTGTVLKIKGPDPQNKCKRYRTFMFEEPSRRSEVPNPGPGDPPVYAVFYSSLRS